MDIDPMESAQPDDDDTEDEQTTKTHERRKSRLNTAVALTVALLATFMGICKVKDDNIVQAMQQAQAKSVDDWSYYQARNIRAEVAQSTADQIRLLALTQSQKTQAVFEAKAKVYQKNADDQQQKKGAIKTAAEDDQKMYDHLNYRDDQFDLSDTLISISISLMALTSLTQKRWLFGLAMVPTFFGVLMGLAGLLAWKLHPDALVRLLS